MAMRLYTSDEFDTELIRRGCQKTDDNYGSGRLWVSSAGLYFIVPNPEEAEGRYPDWLLDDLINTLSLPDAPVSN